MSYTQCTNLILRNNNHDFVLKMIGCVVQLAIVQIHNFENDTHHRCYLFNLKLILVKTHTIAIIL